MTDTYDATRDREQLRLLERPVDKFIEEYRHRPSSTYKRQTVFFFPGGMASQLTRATKKFPSKKEFEYKRVWVIPETPLGGARDLKMHRDSTGTFRDKGDRIIIADAALSLGNCTPHDGLITWCAGHNADLFVFPWDWRRRLDETVKFFVDKFLPFFRDRVKEAGLPNPLERFALIGHSFGGMLANLILRSNDAIVDTMTHVITVGTPFYGYAGQVHRWFEGDSYLNLFGVFKQDMMETIASLPGLYVLHFLDEDTFANGSNQASLTGEQQLFPLPDYPSIDAKIKGLRADAYNPQSDGDNVRYPTLTGFSRTELEYGRQQFQYLASPMDPNLLKKFHNIRGVRTRSDGKTPVNHTIGSITWDWIQTNFDADDKSPIHDDKALVPGDETLPAWTTCLTTNADRCITAKAADIEHEFLMNNKAVLTEIQAILCPEGTEMSVPQTSQPEPASDDDIVQFLRWLSEHWLRIRHLERFDDPELRMLLPTSFQDKLPGIARRFMTDVMKRPGPKGLRGPENDAGGYEPQGSEGGPPQGPGQQPPGPKAPARRPQRKPLTNKLR